jgi:hypothetical protein
MAPKFEVGDTVRLMATGKYASERMREWARGGEKGEVLRVLTRGPGIWVYRVAFGPQFASLLVSESSLVLISSKPNLIGPKPEPVSGPDFQAPFEGKGDTVRDVNGKAVCVPTSGAKSFSYRVQMAERIAQLLNLGVETEQARRRKAVGEAPTFVPEELSENAPW